MVIESYMLWVWLAVFIIMLIVEAVTQDLVSIWLALGAFISLILSIIPNIPYYIEIVVFVVVSFITLIFTRPLVKKMLKNQIRQTNADEFIGKEVIMLKDCNQDSSGEVKINDVIYTATSVDNKPISKGTHCLIVAINGNKLVVKKMEVI